MNYSRANEIKEISLAELFSIIRERIWLIILVVLTFTIGFFVVSKFLIKPTYDSTVKFYIEAKDRDDENPGSGLQAVNLAQKLSNTYIELMKTNNFTNLLLEDISANLRSEDLEDSIRFVSIQNTEILEVNVRTISPELSLDIAESIANIGPSAMNNIKANASLQVIDAPLLTETQSTPNIVRNTVIGFVLGLIIGFGFAIVLELFDVNIKDEDDILRNFPEINLLGVIPKVK